MQTVWLPEELQFLMRTFHLEMSEREAHMCDLYSCMQLVFCASVNSCLFQWDGVWKAAFLLVGASLVIML